MLQYPILRLKLDKIFQIKIHTTKRKAERKRMEQRSIKEPKQQRSIEKKNKIIKFGMELMMKNGYHNTTTDDIAKAAGVSTGIIYRYFYDKKDILMAALTLYFHTLQNQFLSAEIDVSNLHYFLEHVLDEFILLHKTHRNIHEEIESLRHSDSDIRQLYESFIQESIELIIDKFPDTIKGKHFRENVCLAFEIMEGFCHFTMYSKINTDTTYMKALVIEHTEKLISTME